MSNSVSRGRKKFCLEAGCSQDGCIKGYCRLHYLVRWREIQGAKKLRAERRLDDFVNRLAEKYPKDYLKKIKEGLEDDGKFAQTMQDLDMEADKENAETEREFIERFGRKVKLE